MCGLIAAFTDSPLPPPVAQAALAVMHRRGPDAEGEWLDSNGG